LNWAGIKWAFHNTKQAAYWAPVMWLSHMLACQIFGFEPLGTSLDQCAAAFRQHRSCLSVATRLTERTGGACWWRRLFGLHPLRGESVAWVTERKDVLSACFGLLALVSTPRYAWV